MYSNFIIFGNMSQKFWPDMLLFFINGQFGQIKKITFSEN